jgi:Helix-turn-helix domain/GAF domain
MAESFGTRLRKERERRQIALTSIVEDTKISFSLLEALERDDVSHWPSGIFRRSFIRAYAQKISPDPDVVVREFLELYPDPDEETMIGGALPASDGQAGSEQPPTRLQYFISSTVRSRAGLNREVVRRLGSALRNVVGANVAPTTTAPESTPEARLAPTLATPEPSAHASLAASTAAPELPSDAGLALAIEVPEQPSDTELAPMPVAPEPAPDVTLALMAALDPVPGAKLAPLPVAPEPPPNVTLAPMAALDPAPVARLAPMTDAPEPAADAKLAPTMRAPGTAPDLAAAAQLCTQLGCVLETREVPPLLEGAAKILDAAGLVVWVSNGAGTRLRPVLAYGYSDELLAQLPNIRREADNATATAFRSAEPRIVNSSDLANGAVVIPLMTPSGCVGVLAAELRHGGEQRESVRALATIFAAQLATLFVDPVAGTVQAQA